MTLADAGQTEAALAAGRAWIKRAPRDADARLALSYVHVRLRQPYEALHQADQALAIAPGKMCIRDRSTACWPACARAPRC